MLKNRKIYDADSWIDIAERAAWTAIQTTIGLLAGFQVLGDIPVAATLMAVGFATLVSVAKNISALLLHDIPEAGSNATE